MNYPHRDGRKASICQTSICKTACVLRPLNHAAPPFLTVMEGQYQEALFSVLPLGPINKAAATTAALLGKPLYPFRLLPHLSLYLLLFLLFTSIFVAVVAFALTVYNLEVLWNF